MKIFAVFFILLGIFDYVNFKNKTCSKDLIIYFIFMIIVLIFAIYYFSQIFKPSFSYMVLKFLGIEW